ncbi:DUF2796 domain-containing protein [Pseudothauera rhizosphaerae]|uniref:DUF2796 domain-containing protein n=1 Tax=Pseudothauera rhizosphaerae TaxID=2565932 RepID=A0A4S4AYY6_9RHOO|nr:DUF2796 domain-containing protein [Pseudothauera rhizosphaerae]THF65355.1 DUF2796 domain-containing protein [Pseudothauera rhizosphaerae]
MRKLMAALLGLGMSTAALAQHAHEHGVASLQVAVDGGQLAIELETPLDNLVGFEHAPGTDAQRQAVRDAEAKLRDFPRLFVLPAAAGCAVQEVELEWPWAEEDHDHDHKHGHDHEEHHHDEGHSDLHVHYSLACTNPAALEEVRVKLSEAFPRMGSVRAQTATPRGQGSAVLNRAQDKLPL